MRYREQSSILRRVLGSRAVIGHLLVLLLMGTLVILIGAVAGSGSALAQGEAAGQSAPGVLAVSSPISGTYQMVLPLVHRDWQPAPPQVVYLTADPGVVGPGQSTTLSWGVNNEVLGLTLLPGDRNVMGQTSLEVWPAETTVYRLVATSPLGSDSAEVTVTVQLPPEITVLMAIPSQIDMGGRSLLIWRVSDTVNRLVLEPGLGEVTGQYSAWVSPTHTTVYSLTAYNVVGSATAPVTVTVRTPPLISSFTATPANIDLGETSTLSWTVTGVVNSLMLEPGIGDVTGQDGVEVTPAQTTVYTLTATNALGEDTEEVTVTVKLPPQITSFTANPAAIKAGASSTLQWAVVGEVENLTIDQDVGDVMGLGSVVVQPAATTTYKLTASNSAGSDTAQVKVTVSHGPPEITSFTAKPAKISAGGSSTLSWAVTGEVDSLTIDRGVGDVTGLASVVVQPVATTTYKLTATNAAGSDTAQVKVTVSAGPPEITSFTATPGNISAGGSSTLKWTVTGAVTSLKIDPGVGDVTGLTSKVVQPAATTTYKLTATNAAGSDTAQVKVTVGAGAPEITSFTATPANISAGGSSTLKWTVTGAVTSLKIDPGVGDVTGLTSKVVQPAATTTYKLTATNAAGSDTAQVKVTVGGGSTKTELLVYDWNRPVTKADRGFPRDFPPMENGNWVTPVDFAHGTFYFRVQIKQMPVVKQMKLQFCVWQAPRLSVENCGPQQALWGNRGTVATWSVGVQNMWKKNGVPINWSIPRQTNGVAIKAMSGVPVSDYGDWNWAGDDPDEWYPLDWRFTVVVVAKGATFSGWGNYIP